MSATVLLVGIEHQIQSFNPNFAIPPKDILFHQFKDYLKQTAFEFKVKVLAEEFSTEALEKNYVEKSITKEVADEIGVEHIFCDPTTEEREKYGIDNTDTDKREMFWIKRLQQTNNEPILFICGESHLPTFPSKLKSEGYTPKILSSGWGKGI